MLFFPSPSRAISVIAILLIISVCVSLAVYFKTRKKLLSVFILSLLSYLTFYFSVDSRIFAVYHLKWLVKFTLWYWPWLNLALLILLILNFLKNKNAKNG